MVLKQGLATYSLKVGFGLSSDCIQPGKQGHWCQFGDRMVLTGKSEAIQWGGGQDVVAAVVSCLWTELH